MISMNSKKIDWVNEEKGVPKITPSVLGYLQDFGQTIFLLKYNPYYLSKNDLRFILIRDKECLGCNSKPKYMVLGKPTVIVMSTGEMVSIDHIIPKFWGGDDSVDNYQLLCTKCNNEKADLLPASLLSSNTPLTKKISFPKEIITEKSKNE